MSEIDKKQRKDVEEVKKFVFKVEWSFENSCAYPNNMTFHRACASL